MLLALGVIAIVVSAVSMILLSLHCFIESLRNPAEAGAKVRCRQLLQ